MPPRDGATSGAPTGTIESSAGLEELRRETGAIAHGYVSGVIERLEEKA